MTIRDQLNVRIDHDLKALVDADTRTNQDITEAALWREFSGERVGALNVRIEHKEARIETVKREIQDLEEELQNLKSEREALIKKREEIQTEDAQYRNNLQDLLDRVEDGDLERITTMLTDVDEIASGRDESPEDVVQDAAELAAQQNRGLQNTHFLTPKETARLDPTDVMVVSEWVSENGGEEQ